MASLREFDHRHVLSGRSAKEALQDQIIADFQRKVAKDHHAQSGRVWRNAFAACERFGIRARVKPWNSAISTINAWLNGNNQYVMGDDASFNPNGQLRGN